MENSLQSAKEGALFQTSGVEFNYKTVSNSMLQETRRFGLVVISDLDIQGGALSPLGGEKRFVDWLPLKTDLPFQNCPQDIQDEIVKSGYCRLLLVTPAYFGGTNLSGNTLTGLGAEVIATINNRFQTVSGWDYQKKRPKATKHLVPAGSVFFLRLSD
jgi:CRISPR-associated protein Cmr3